MFGFLNVYKPVGKTSHDVVAVLRRVTKVKQIGHTGTLDPFAEGVLPICIGKATRLIEYLEDDKAYIGTIQLGKSTSTYDTEGEVVKFSDKVVTLEEIEQVLDLFRGKIKQLPPIYSAIKVKGKKLYEYARKGEDVEIQPREVLINKLEILNYDYEKKELELVIECSKGTYIRSIANDLGEKLGTYGHLTKLVRIRAGKFDLDDAVKLEDLDLKEKVLNHLISPLETLNIKRYELSLNEFEKVQHGNSFYAEIPDGKFLLISDNKLIAVATSKNNLIKCEKVFV